MPVSFFYGQSCFESFWLCAPCTRDRDRVRASYLPVPCYAYGYLTASMRKFASGLGLADEGERVFVMASPRRLADVTVLQEVSLLLAT